MRSRIPLRTILKRPNVLETPDTAHTCGKCGHDRLRHRRESWRKKCHVCFCGCVRRWSDSDKKKQHRNDIGKLTAQKMRAKHKRSSALWRRASMRRHRFEYVDLAELARTVFS